jgi:hypothetical protein
VRILQTEKKQMPTDIQRRVNTYLIREKVLTNAYSSEVAEQLVAVECPFGAATLVADTAEQNGISIEAALARARGNGRNHPALFAWPDSSLSTRNSWPPVPGGKGWAPAEGKNRNG